MFDLNGKKALVTGASRGIGKGIALCLAKAGADVVVNYRSKQEEAEEVVAEIKKMGRQAFSVQADVSQKEEVVRMMGEVTAKFGSLDILVNNAGVLGFSPLSEMTDEEWDRVLDVNLRGYFLVTREAVKVMLKEKGWGRRIINIASIASGQVGIGFANGSHYDASKGGIIAFSESIAAELAPQGINVNCIAPGLIDTDMVSGMMQDE
ncbi:beta-ketoacyl-ACP reductase, partial [candidate division WWE3 bacterium CG_4_8_14_3_um_filter_42_11]